MSFHLFVSVALAVAGTLVSSAFGMETHVAALIGLVIFLAYWGVCLIFVDLDV